MDHEEKYNTARWDAGQVRREGGERPTHSAQSAASEERRRRNRRKGREDVYKRQAGDGLPAGTYTTFYRCRLIAADGGWYGEILGNGSW